MRDLSIRETKSQLTQANSDPKIGTIASLGQLRAADMQSIQWSSVLIVLSIACNPTERSESTVKSTDAPAKIATPPAKSTEPRYEKREKHDENGIGKFYMGREIARVMGHEAAEWLERPEREQEERSSKLLETLKLKNGDVVCDLGAGSGYFSFPLAAKVAPKGKVLAVDIQQEMLDIITKKMKDKKVTNIDLILGTEADPKLPEAGVDLILLVDVYHEFSDPYEMTVAMTKALKPGGRLVFVEFREEDDKVPILAVHKMSQKQVLKEMTPHSLKHVKTLDVLPWQHIIIFEKKAEEASEKKP
jgi:ubiquinone/menaquinone biosynthesis C-methylase UbiE